MLGVSAALSEAEEHWRAFLESLQARGLRGVALERLVSAELVEIDDTWAAETKAYIKWECQDA